MNVINVTLDANVSAFEPGQTIAGEAIWNLDAPAKAIEISLIWYTLGKGDTDRGKPWTHRVEHPAPEGRERFSLTLPAGPYSFSGRLISLLWAIEATVLPGKTKFQRELVLAPGQREVVLD